MCLCADFQALTDLLMLCLPAWVLAGESGPETIIGDLQNSLCRATSQMWDAPEGEAYAWKEMQESLCGKVLLHVTL